MNRTHGLLVDSFAAVKAQMSHLFERRRTRDQAYKEVAKYVVGGQRSNHNNVSQQRSWVAANLTALAKEAARRKNARVAECALLFALQEGELVRHMDPAWVTSAAQSCATLEELEQLEARVRSRAESITAKEASRQNKDLTTKVEVILSTLNRGVAVRRAITRGELQANSENSPALVRHQAEEDVEAVRHMNDIESLAHSLSQPSSSVVDTSVVPAVHRSMMAVSQLQEQRSIRTVLPNQSFSRYFLRQGIVRDEAELSALVDSMRRRPELVGFRVHCSHPHGSAAQSVLDARDGVHRVSWLPNCSGAYVVDTSASVPFSRLQADRQLLGALAKERVLSYQSTSSMFPVFCLDPQPNDTVLDMCAAPGSKTMLLLEHSTRNSSTGELTSAHVVASEANHSRAHDLGKRLTGVSPRSAVLHGRGEALLSYDNFHPSRPQLSFDKVLLDAPCSGEGRMGREVLSWRLWHPQRGLEFFSQQRELLRRAIQLCKVGGLVVYSTCSLNPLENEAVVASVLREGQASVVLEHPPTNSHHVLLRQGGGTPTSQPGDLRLTRGLRTWLVPSPSGGFYRGDGTEDRDAPPALFPPRVSEGEQEQHISDELHRCCRRVLPHLNDGSDGFFVAVLRKHRSHSSFAHPLPEPTRQSLSPLAWREADTSSQRGSQSSDVSSSNVVQQHGLSCLPPQHEVVCRCFEWCFPPPSTATMVQDFIVRTQLSCMWSSANGLSLVSNAVVAQLSAIPASSSTNLLTLGTQIVDAQGRLTEAGARMISPAAKSGVLCLPLKQLQLLLANGKILAEDCGSVPVPVGGSGNAVVRVATPFVKDSLYDAIGEWRVPVWISASSTGTSIQLSLTSVSRRRYSAMLGRLLSLKNTKRSLDDVRKTIQMSNRYMASSVMSSGELHGRYERRAPLTTDRSTSAPAAVARQDGSPTTAEVFTL